MKLFSLNYKLHSPEDYVVLNNLMEAWEGQKVMESTWILKRNDGCTCRDIVDDLLDHITADNEIFVVEIKEKDHKPLMAFNISRDTGADNVL